MKLRSIIVPAALIAAIIALLALCGFAAYELGLFDPWLQKPSADPVKTVQSAIEGQAGKDYTITVRVDEIKIDEAETERVKARYIGSELAEAWGWTDEYLEEHFIVVWAKYYVEYDHTKTFLDDGPTEQYFYLTAAILTAQSQIWLTGSQATTIEGLHSSTPKIRFSGMAYNNTADLWESGVACPHIILKDLAAIFHPDSTAGINDTAATLRYYYLLH